MTARSESDEMTETPQARPSRPSIRFIEFVRPTIQRSVSGIDQPPRTIVCEPNEMNFIAMPSYMARNAASI